MDKFPRGGWELDLDTDPGPWKTSLGPLLANAGMGPVGAALSDFHYRIRALNDIPQPWGDEDPGPIPVKREPSRPLASVTRTRSEGHPAGPGPSFISNDPPVSRLLSFEVSDSLIYVVQVRTLPVNALHLCLHSSPHFGTWFSLRCLYSGSSSLRIPWAATEGQNHSRRF